MTVTYDPHADALYISFGGTSVHTQELDNGLNLDIDGAKHLTGIEILDASKLLGSIESLQHVDFQLLGPPIPEGDLLAKK
jgi:uncharacterized protein YuzE